MRWRQDWNTAWMRYPLWIWGGVSLACWQLLSPQVMCVITPYMGGALLLGTALVISWLRLEIADHASSPELTAELRITLGAVLLTAAIGLAFPWLLPLMAGELSPEECRIAWVLCSGGFVLSLIISRLVLTFARAVE